jgi:cytochrome c oxidase cbb3-type subunit 3
VFFEAHCKQCHSASGVLAQIGSKFKQAAHLQQRFLRPASTGPAKGTVTTPSGQKVAGTLLKNDDFFIALRDSAGAFHEWPKSEVKLELEDKLSGHRAILPLYSNADIHNMTASSDTEMRIHRSILFLIPAWFCTGTRSNADARPSAAQRLADL